MAGGFETFRLTDTRYSEVNLSESHSSFVEASGTWEVLFVGRRTPVAGSLD